MRRRRQGAALWAALTLATAGTTAVAAESLHDAIDRLVEAKAGGRVTAPASDAEVMRRVYLDLSGMVPTSAEARTFLDDPSPDKRRRLIDRLLDDPRFARRMQDVFDAMWMERRADLHVPAKNWRDFLRHSFAENKPYNVLVREVIEADGSDPARRAPAKFALDREVDPNVLTRDVGRLFLGVDMQCAQCHDHPLIDDYKQAHYYGLFAFLGRSSLFLEPPKDPVVVEKADGDVTFSSVFKKGKNKVVHATGPRLFDTPPLAEEKAPKGQEYIIAPGGKVRPVPRYSRRALLGPALTGGRVPEFNRNAANRLWWVLLGRGIVHPLDLNHSDNPPSHPELIDLLARELAAHDFDIKWFLREVALTRTYQRSSEPPPDASAEIEDPARFAVAALKPLSPEQLAWTLMQATGVVDATRAAAEQKLEGVDPRMKAILHSDPKRLALRGRLLEEAVHDALGGNVGPFVNQFAGAPGQPQDGGDSTVHQALFLSNGQPVQGWLAPSGANLTGRLLQMTSPLDVADEMYLSVLTRRPTDEERAEAAEYLIRRSPEQKAAVIQELIWALVASTEFRFNH